MKVKLAIAALCTLAGCDNRPLNELTYSERQEFLEVVTARCTEAGAPPGSDKFVTCGQAEIDAENAKRANRRTAGVALGAGLQSYGNHMSAAAISPPRQVTCNTYAPMGYGLPARTTCY